MKVVRIIFSFLRFDRANWKAVILCVMAAFVFWIFNAFNKTYSTNVRFPILFEFDGERYSPAEHLPKTLTVNVSGNGWDLFRRRIGVRMPQLIIPIERPNEVKKIVATSLAGVLSSQVGNLKVNFVVTDTLEIQVDKRDWHRYKLSPDISSITFKQGYGRISPIVVLPDSVKLDGPESRLHAMFDSIILTLDKKNVSENFREEVEVSFAGSEFVKRDPPVAQVMFEVGQVESIIRKIKIAPSGLTIESDVNATFQIPLSREADFDSQLHEVTGAVNPKTSRTRKSAIPSVRNLPTYALLLRIDSVHFRNN